jgi:hypothetical protein
MILNGRCSYVRLLLLLRRSDQEQEARQLRSAFRFEIQPCDCSYQIR